MLAVPGDKPGEDTREWWKLQLDFLLWHETDLSDGARFEIRKIRIYFNRTGRITADHQRFVAGCRRVLGMGVSFDSTIKGVKKAIIDKALKFTNGNKKQAAMLLKMKRPTLQGHIKELKLVEAEESFPGNVVIESQDNALAESALQKAAHTEQLFQRVLDNQAQGHELLQALRLNAEALAKLTAAMRERWDKPTRKAAPTVIGVANTDAVRKG